MNKLHPKTVFEVISACKDCGYVSRHVASYLSDYMVFYCALQDSCPDIPDMNDILPDCPLKDALEELAK
jgi:hypothetical protein